MFTARYGLIPYITQTLFFFKMLNKSDVAVWTAEATQCRRLLIPYNNLKQQDRQEEIL